MYGDDADYKFFEFLVWHEPKLKDESLTEASKRLFEKILRKEQEKMGAFKRDKNLQRILQDEYAWYDEITNNAFFGHGLEKISNELSDYRRHSTRQGKIEVDEILDFAQKPKELFDRILKEKVRDAKGYNY